MPTQISIDDLAPSLVTTIEEAGAAVTIGSIDITDSGGNVLDDTAVSTSGGYIKINGSGFTGNSSIIIGSVVASSSTYVSPTVYLAQVPAQTAGSYTVYLVASTGETATRPIGLTYSGTPSWVTGTTLTSADSGSAYSLQLNATGATSYALAAGSSLPSGLTLSSGGLISGTVTVENTTTYSFTINAIDAELQDSPRTFTLDVAAITIGQVAYTTAGTYSWTAPAGVTSVSVVCVGGGGGATANTGDYGGAGGGLGWKNNITVVPGQSYTVVVGAAGVSRSSGSPSAGGDSYFIQNDSNSYCAGKGGYAGSSGGSGGAYFGDGGGNGGGAGGPYGWDGSYPYKGERAGGGAGGYSPSSTNHAGQASFGRTNDNSGSPAGGNNRYGGGGVGILGKGDTGLYGSNGGSGGDGGGGSGGGGNYGGGAGTWNNIYFGQPGGGAVRIIWGPGRAFPSTLTTDQ